MAVAYGAAGTRATSAGATTLSPAMPSGTASGEMLLAIVSIKSNDTISTPTGYTKLGQVNSGAGWTTAYYWKLCDKAQSAVAYTWTSSVACEAIVYRITSALPTGPVFPTPTTGSGTAISIAAITTTANSSLALVNSMHAGAGTYSSPTAGWTNRSSANSNGTSNYTSTKSVATSGTSTGTFAVTQATSAVWTGVQVEFLDYVQGGGTNATYMNSSDVGGTPTLSNFNRTIASSVDGTNQFSRTAHGSSSAFYFEFEVTDGGAGNCAAVVTNGTQTLTTADSSSPNRGVYIGSGGAYYSDNIPNYSTFSAAGANGDRVCVAVDPVNGRIWARLNGGNWNNSGTANPATNTGGINISAFGSTLYAVGRSGFSFTPTTLHFSSAEWVQTPPSGFSQITAGGSTYNDSVSESSSISDTVTGTFSSVTMAVAEAATVTDGQTGLLLISGSIAEALAAADSTTAALTLAAAVAESAAAADTATGLLAADGAVSEAASATDTQTGTALFSVAVSESAAVADSQAAALTIAASIAESMAASDTQTGGLLFAVTVAETAAASDTQTGFITMFCDRQEVMAVADTPAATAAFVVAVAESAAIADTPAGALTLVGAIAETIAASDTAVGGSIYAATVAEGLTIADSQSVQVALAASVAEALAIADAAGTTLVAVAQVLEATGPVDVQTADGPPTADEFRVGGANVTDIVQTLNVATIYHTQKKTG